MNARNVRRTITDSSRIVMGWLLAAASLVTLASCNRSPPPRVVGPPPAAAAENAPADGSDGALLSTEIRQHLWDIEHLCFVFEQKVFPKLSQTLAAADGERLSAYLSPDFSARVPQTDWQETFRSGDVRYFQWDQTAENTRTVAAAGFLEVLTAYRRLFSAGTSDCKVGLGMVRLGPVDRANMNGPWRAVWQIRYAGRRDGGPVELFLRLAVDLDTINEQIPERQQWVRAATVEQLKRVESPAVLMRDVTAESGISTQELYDNWRPNTPFKPNTGGAYLCDYNRDGHLDVLIDDVLAGVTLYQGRGDGRFVDATVSAGLPKTPRPDYALCCWADFDGDGDEDLICHDRLYENLGDGTFRDVTDRTNLLLTPASGYAVADYDGDGRVDLYVCHTGAYRLGQREREQVSWIDGGLGIENVLWRNLGDWQFADVTESTRTGGGGISCFAAVWFDANQDGRPDLLAINEFGRNAMLLSQPNHRFVETDVDPVFGGLSMGVTTLDCDNDGRTDVYVANMYSKAGNRILANVDTANYPPELFRKIVDATTGSKLYRARGDGTFDIVPAADIIASVGWAYGANACDLNGDGLQDLYATAGFRSVQRGKPDG